MSGEIRFEIFYLAGSVVQQVYKWSIAIFHAIKIKNECYIESLN